MTRSPRRRLRSCEDGVRLRRDRAFMETVGEWPRWPTLPLRRRAGGSSGDAELGFLYGDLQPKVYLGNVFDILSKSKDPRLWHKVLAGCETRCYENLDALAAEWTVD